MSAACGLLLLIFGFTMLKFICCYSDGSLLFDQCQSMAINHGTSQAAGQDPNIFTVDPDNVIVDGSQVGRGITVTLSASSGSFMGYMLEVRECDDCQPAGTFSGLDGTSVLLCGGQAVAQTDNSDKYSVQVTWTPQATGQFFFRAAFVQDFSSFWTKKSIILPTTTTLPLATMPMTTSPPATTLTTTQIMMEAMMSTMTQTTTQTTTTTQTMTTPTTTLQMMMTTATTTTTDTTTTVTTRRTTIDTSTATPTSAVNSTQTGLTVFTTPNLQTTVNTTQTDPTTNTTVISNTQSQTPVNTTQTDPTTNTTVITTSNTPSHTTVNTTQTAPTTNTTVITTSNTQSQTTVNTIQTDPTTNTTVIPTANTQSQTTVNTTQTNPTTNTTLTSNTQSQTTVNTTQTDSTTNTTVITTTVTPSYLLQCVQYMRSGVALLLFSRLCFLGGSFLLMIIKPVSKMPTQIASIIELISKIIATVLVLIKAVHFDCENAGLQFVFAALIVTAMVTSLMHTITVFLHCGPSHELRTCWIASLIIVDLLNTLITSISIFYGLWWFQGRWLLIVMAVYVILEFILYLGAAVSERVEKHKTRQRVEQNRPVPENRKSPWFFMFVICLVIYVMFTVALIVGVSLLCFQAGSSCILFS